MKNIESNYVKILKEICKEEGIVLTSFSDDWAFHLQKGEQQGYVMGYQFGLNSAVSKDICNDKSVASQVLAHHQIPCVPHYFIPGPLMLQYMNLDSGWESSLELLEKYGKIVCKDNHGTGGQLVFFVENKSQLELAAQEIFSASDSMAISPSVDILEEYRVVVLDGQAKLMFQKIRPGVVGDGARSVGELYLEYLLNGGEAFPLTATLCKKVPQAGEWVYFSQKHNLGKGARGAVVTDEDLKQSLETLALATAKALEIRFCSVDIIQTTDGLSILEVNGGVMMEHFAGQSAECYETAKKIYKEALLKMFA